MPNRLPLSTIIFKFLNCFRSFEQVIEAYTINNAYVMRMEDKIGSIEVGKYADMVVFNENLFEIEPHTVHEAKVYETIMNGVTRYKLEK